MLAKNIIPMENKNTIMRYVFVLPRCAIATLELSSYFVVCWLFLDFLAVLGVLTLDFYRYSVNVLLSIPISSVKFVDNGRNIKLK